MVYMALKEWRSALHFLGIVISTPSVSSVSLIMVEAYKKWVLVSLLEKGKVSRRPFCPLGKEEVGRRRKESY